MGPLWERRTINSTAATGARSMVSRVNPRSEGISTVFFYESVHREGYREADGNPGEYAHSHRDDHNADTRQDKGYLLRKG